MGSLLEGAAVGIGINTERTANQRDITEREDLQRQHDIRLEGLRNKNAMDAATQSNIWDVDAATAQDTRAVSAASELARTTSERDASRYTHESEMEGNKNALEIWKTNADNESDEWVAAYRAWSTARSGAKGTNRKANSWDVSFQEVPDPDNPGMYIQAMVASHPNGTSVQQVGNRMIEHTQDGPERDHALKPWKDAAKGHEAEMALLKSVADGNDQSEAFLNDFGYLPTSYYRAAFAVSDDADLQEFNESFNRDRGGPAFPYPGKMPHSTRDKIEGTTPGDGGGKTPVTQEEEAAALAGGTNLDPTTGSPGPPADLPATAPNRGPIDRAGAPMPAASKNALSNAAATAPGPASSQPVGTTGRAGALTGELAGEVGHQLKDWFTGGYSSKEGRYIRGSEREKVNEAHRKENQ